MLMQNFGVTNKEHYGMLWYFWSGQLRHVHVPGHTHPEKENSDGKSLKSNASLAVVMKSETPEA